MDTKNSKQHVADATNQLSNARKCLNNALRNAEKPPENNQQIQDTLNAVERALQSATATLTNYKG
ncbi:MAG: EscE/YscE/SsaE family type III secretion system needle protein co-chaperone [Desulfosporosinus sp.]|nr:EscE/YscE/SsaE family type III secretion system needle protein co-chaperone [Desulfosporosinus sp.]